MSLEKTLPQFNALTATTVSNLVCGYQTDLGHWTAGQIKTFAGLSAFVVGKDATLFNYVSIQTAINAAALIATASVPVTIYITPGVYTGNLTLAPYVNLASTNSWIAAINNLPFSQPSATQIVGNMTLNF